VTAFSHQVVHENSTKEKTIWSKPCLEAFKLNFKSPPISWGNLQLLIPAFVATSPFFWPDLVKTEKMGVCG
jgi:hypothetical protein